MGYSRKGQKELEVTEYTHTHTHKLDEQTIKNILAFL